MKKKFLIYLFLSILLSACNTTKNTCCETENKNKTVAAINVKLGMAYLEQGDKQRAKQKLAYALEKAPELPEAWYSMAYLQESTSHPIEAKKYYLKALELAPNRGDVHNNFGTFLCRSGAYQEAINHFLTATKDPQYLDLAGAYENAGLCSLKIPDKKQAMQYFNLALAQDADRVVSLAELTKLKEG